MWIEAVGWEGGEGHRYGRHDEEWSAAVVGESQ